MSDTGPQQTFQPESQAVPVPAIDPESVPSAAYKGQRRIPLLNSISLDWEPGEDVYGDIAARYRR